MSALGVQGVQEEDGDSRQEKGRHSTGEETAQEGDYGRVIMGIECGATV